MQRRTFVRHTGTVAFSIGVWVNPSDNENILPIEDVDKKKK
jgi:hypothetical protein